MDTMDNNRAHSALYGKRLHAMNLSYWTIY